MNRPECIRKMSSVRSSLHLTRVFLVFTFFVITFGLPSNDDIDSVSENASRRSNTLTRHVRSTSVWDDFDQEELPGVDDRFLIHDDVNDDGINDCPPLANKHRTTAFQVDPGPPLVKLKEIHIRHNLKVRLSSFIIGL